MEFNSLEEAEAYFQKQIDEEKKLAEQKRIQEYRDLLAREGSYDSILMKGIKPKGTKRKASESKPQAKKQDKLQDAMKAAEHNRKNKFGTAGLGGLDKDGLGDSLVKTFNTLFQ